MLKTIGYKTLGYLISTLSVALLGVAAWDGASKHPLTLIALILGMITSVAGMACRWLSFMRDHREELRKAGVRTPLTP